MDAEFFTFTPQNSRPCSDVFIFSDDLYEETEDFSVQSIGVRDSSGINVVANRPGVTVRPSEATVFIENSDGTFFCFAFGC